MLDLLNEFSLPPMPEESQRASDSARPALMDLDRDQLTHAVRRCAREKNLSRAVTDRYEAWIFVFVSWCYEHPPHRVDQGRIGAFQEVLQQSADAGEKEVYQAMDALAFLFGTADEVTSLLDSWDASSKEGTAPASIEESGSRSGDEDGLQTLQVGWQSGPDTPLDRTADAEGEEESEEGEFSTAELCIERFQAQVESLHAPDAEASDSSEEAVGPEEGPPEPNSPSS